jgi:hypothetical protein
LEVNVVEVWALSLAFLVVDTSKRAKKHGLMTTHTAQSQVRHIYQKRTFHEPKFDEMTGEWRKLHDEELRNLYSLPSTIRMIKLRKMMWVGRVAIVSEKRYTYRILVGKPERKRPLERPRFR